MIFSKKQFTLISGTREGRIFQSTVHHFLFCLQQDNSIQLRSTVQHALYLLNYAIASSLHSSTPLFSIYLVNIS